MILRNNVSQQNSFVIDCLVDTYTQKCLHHIVVVQHVRLSFEMDTVIVEFFDVTCIVLLFAV